METLLIALVDCLFYFWLQIFCFSFFSESQTIFSLNDQPFLFEAQTKIKFSQRFQFWFKKSNRNIHQFVIRHYRRFEWRKMKIDEERKKLKSLCKHSFWQYHLPFPEILSFLNERWTELYDTKPKQNTKHSIGVCVWDLSQGEIESNMVTRENIEMNVMPYFDWQRFTISSQRQCGGRIQSQHLPKLTHCVARSVSQNMYIHIKITKMTNNITTNIISNMRAPLSWCR